MIADYSVLKSGVRLISVVQATFDSCPEAVVPAAWESDCCALCPGHFGTSSFASEGSHVTRRLSREFAKIARRIIVPTARPRGAVDLVGTDASGDRGK